MVEPPLRSARLSCTVLAMSARALVVVLAAAVVLGGVGGADAHTVPAVESLGSAAGVDWAPPSTSALRPDVVAAEPLRPLWPVLLLATLALALGRRRTHRLIAAVLVVLVGVFVFETALHSVHHGLGDERMACPTASVAAHVHSTMSSLVATDTPILGACLALTVSEPLVRSQQQV